MLSACPRFISGFDLGLLRAALQGQALNQQAGAVQRVGRQPDSGVQLLRTQHILFERLGNRVALEWHNPLIGLSTWRVLRRIKHDNKFCRPPRV